MSHDQQHGTGAVERGIDDREDGVICRTLHHAAGLVVRRFTITNAKLNIKSENKTSVAMEAGSGNTAGLAGWSKFRNASTP